MEIVELKIKYALELLFVVLIDVKILMLRRNLQIHIRITLDLN